MPRNKTLHFPHHQQSFQQRERRNTMIAMLKYVMDMLQILAQGPETEEDGYLEMREEARG